MIAEVAFGVLFVIGTLAVWVWAAPRLWRGEGRLKGGEMPAYFPFSEPVWRGIVRSFVVWPPLVALMIGGSVLAALSEESSTAFNIGMSLAALGLFGGMAIHFSILFFNRPKFLVPPLLRGEPGAIEAWRRARARAG